MSEAQPLLGLRVLVPRSTGQADKTVRALEALGATPLPLAMIRIAPSPEPEALRAAARAVATYDVVALTSENAVERFFEALAEVGLDRAALASVTVAAVGSATARALEARGVVASVVPVEQRAEGLAAALLAHEPLADRLARGEVRVLLPRARVAREVLPDTLRARGVAVDVVAAYETLPAGDDQREWLRSELSAGRVDAVLLTSGSTAESFADLVAGVDVSRACLASIGPVTTEAATRRGLPVAVEAEEVSIDGLLRALVRHRASAGTDAGAAPPGAQPGDAGEA